MLSAVLLIHTLVVVIVIRDIIDLKWKRDAPALVFVSIARAFDSDKITVALPIASAISIDVFER